MGRGRAKAKQVKVARQLKYNGGGTDLDRLRAELGVGADHDDGAYDPVAADHDDDDAEEEDEEDDEWSASCVVRCPASRLDLTDEQALSVPAERRLVDACAQWGPVPG